MTADPRRDLIGALADFYVGHADAGRFPMLAEVGGYLGEALLTDSVEEPEPVDLPVGQLLVQIDTESDVDGVTEILRAFVTAGSVLRWIQTPAYAETLPQHFLDNYGYIRVIGPGGLVESPVASVGLGIWGAGLHYPCHEHPAEETYHVLHGSALFQRGDGPWEPKAVGESVHHDAWERHAQRFGDETCVLLWSWIGDVAVDARIVSDGA